MIQIDREYEVYASNIATQVLDHITSRSFDERTTPDVLRTALSPDSTEFTLRTNFGSSPACNLYQPSLDTAICDDVDDLHLPDTVWQSINYVADTVAVPFDVTAQVVYVNSSNPEVEASSGVRTYTKQVTVSVQSSTHRQENRQGGYAQLTRLVIYNEDVAEAHMDASTPVCDSGTTRYVNPMHLPIWINQMGATAGTCP